MGTVAAGVSKAHADVVLISGHDGGTGASPLTSLKHAGAPVGARPGRDAADAAAQRPARPHRRAGRRPAQDRPRRRDRRAARGRGVRVRHRPAGGVGLRDDAGLPPRHLPGGRGHPEPRAAASASAASPSSSSPSSSSSPRRFASYLADAAASARWTRRSAGSDLLDVAEAVDHWKASGLDLTPILHRPGAGRRHQPAPAGRPGPRPRAGARPPAHRRRPRPPSSVASAVVISLAHRQRQPHRRHHARAPSSPGVTAAAGLPDDTIDLTLTGSAGQSFGAFVPRGITLHLEGDANDYVGKGLSGGRIVLRPPRGLALRGRGEHHRRQRDPLRRDQRRAVHPGRGRRAVLRAQLRRGRRGRRRGRPRLRVHDRRPGGGAGPTGRNFGAGMSGGIAYVLDTDGWFLSRTNPEMVDVEPLARRRRGLAPGPHRAAPGRDRFGRGPASARRLGATPARFAQGHARTTSGCSRRSAGPRSTALDPTEADHGGSEARWVTRPASSSTTRELPRRRAVPVRLHDWQEVYEPFADEAPARQASRCMDCGIPFCHNGCPLGQPHPRVERPRLPRRLADGHRPAPRHQQLPRVHRPAVPGAVRGRVRARHQQPTRSPSSRSRSRSSTGPSTEGWVRPLPPTVRTGKRVAVVGSGPAGLAAAQQLTRAGHTVAVFERADRIGGLLRYGIPEFKMEKRHLDRRLDQMQRRGHRSSAPAPRSASTWAAGAARTARRGRARRRGHAWPRPARPGPASCRASTRPWSTCPGEPGAARATSTSPISAAGQARRHHRRRRHRRRLPGHGAPPGRGVGPPVRDPAPAA